MADTGEAIALLRRLHRMTDSGVITGNVQTTLFHDDYGRDTGAEYISAPNHKVLAKRLSDGIEYSALSDSDGHYEFQSLPSGKYHITPNKPPGLWAEDGDTDVSPGSCTQINFELSADGQISGHVTSADGRPFDVTPWIEVQSDDPHFSWSTPLDDQGYYQLHGLPAGRYLVGIGITSEPTTPEWHSRVYYPGVHSKELAAPVDIGKAEVRSDIDFSFDHPPPPNTTKTARPKTPSPTKAQTNKHPFSHYLGTTANSTFTASDYPSLRVALRALNVRIILPDRTNSHTTTRATALSVCRIFYPGATSIKQQQRTPEAAFYSQARLVQLPSTPNV